MYERIDVAAVLSVSHAGRLGGLQPEGQLPIVHVTVLSSVVAHKFVQLCVLFNAGASFGRGILRPRRPMVHVNALSSVVGHKVCNAIE